MNRHTLDTLEHGALLGLLAHHVQTPLGRSRIIRLRPAADRDAIDHALELTTECVRFLDSGKRLGLSGVEEPEPSLSRLHVAASILEARQVLELEHLVTVGMGLRACLRGSEERAQYPCLAGVTNRIPDLRGLLAEIRGKVLPGGEIDDHASPELRRIRHELQSSRSRIYRALEGLLRQQARAVQEDLITFRNGRFVIPVRTDARVQVPGVVHGLSSSGQTTFIEPLTVIDQNNDLVRLREQEEMEITRILSAITESFRRHETGIRELIDAVAEIDLVQAKALLSLEFACVRPRLTATRELRLRAARHILLDHALRQTGGRAVPISLVMDDAHQVLVISGPNAGGKTVVLKTVGLIALMAQMGLHVPAEEALLPVFAQVSTDIGDQQSIAANLSTFTAHMRNIAEMAQKVVLPALLLIDEVGTGTDPEEGASLAVAIIDYFRRAGATTLTSTHYNPLKMWASRTAGVLNASVEFDERTLRPTYRLITGVAGASSGLEIARRMDVPEAILDQARQLADPGHSLAGEYLKKLKSLADEQVAQRAALEAERAATAQEHARLAEDFERREAARRAEFDAALERAVHEFSRESEQLIHGLKDRITAEKLRKDAQNRASRLRRTGSEASRDIAAGIGLAAGRLQAGARPAAGRPSGEPGEGDRVWVKPLGQAGTVASLQGDTYQVTIGVLKYRAQREDLQLLESAPASRRGPEPVKPAPELTLEPLFTPELNVIGMTADEAVQRVDKFLDESFLADAQSIRIIHGHGKGILRRAIAELLTGHPQVESFHLAAPNQGGAGATVVELRK
jgi:DNA mismatch repair protein MutS2